MDKRKFLLLASSLSWIPCIISSELIWFLCASGIVISVCISFWVQAFTKSVPLSPFLVFGWGGPLFFNLGILSSILMSSRAGFSLANYQDLVGVTWGQLAIAHFYQNLLFGAFLCFADFQYLKVLVALANRKLNDFNIQDVKPIYGTLIALSLVEVTFLSTGLYGYRGYNIEGYDQGKLAWYVPLLNILPLFKVPLLALCLKNAFFGSGRKQSAILFLLTSLPTVLIAFSVSRRSIGITLFFIALWFAFLSPRKIPLLRWVITLVVTGTVIYPIFGFFNLIRTEENLTSGESIGTIILSSLEDGGLEDLNSDEFEERNVANLVIRSAGVSSFLTEVVDEVGFFQNPLLGDDFRTSIAWVLPRFLSSSKNIIPAEDLYYSKFGVRFDGIDRADSTVVSSFADFSWFGILIYPILLIAIFALELILILKVNTSLVFAGLMNVVIQPLLFSGSEGATYAFLCDLRNLMALVLLWVALERILKSRPSSRTVLPA